MTIKMLIIKISNVVFNSYLYGFILPIDGHQPLFIPVLIFLFYINFVWRIDKLSTQKLHMSALY